jgi:hypothetical protein
MERDRPKYLLTEYLLEIDQARNASPRIPQQPSEMVRERESRLAALADKISALRQARESAFTNIPPSPTDETMARKRELIDTGTDKRYVRRNKLGTSFIESDDLGRSLAADRRKRAKTKVKAGEGDKGDRQRSKAKRKAASKTGRSAAAKSTRREGAARKSTRKKAAKRR